ncbi:glycosyltransferase [Mycetocola zhujimingii]|nr:glycosyltransferase [Mycetocola zhujimingii]
MAEMADGPQVSVCMAAYNGSQFIEDQVHSILSQLGDSDELIIIDDCSTDDTVEHVKRIDDDRIRLLLNESNIGYVKTFDRALRASRGRYVFLADQDDLWPAGRVEAMTKALESADVVAGNLEILGQPGQRTPSPLRAEQSDQHLLNIVNTLADRRGYWGCAMGVRQDFLRIATPLPAPLFESHDLWLALLGNATGSISHLEQTVTLRRIHEHNATPLKRRSIPRRIRSRVMLIQCLLIGMRRARLAGWTSRSQQLNAEKHGSHA